VDTFRGTRKRKKGKTVKNEAKNEEKERSSTRLFGEGFNMARNGLLVPCGVTHNPQLAATYSGVHVHYSTRYYQDIPHASPCSVFEFVSTKLKF
jgi:hypothetical protein